MPSAVAIVIDVGKVQFQLNSELRLGGFFYLLLLQQRPQGHSLQCPSFLSQFFIPRENKLG